MLRWRVGLLLPALTLVVLVLLPTPARAASCSLGTATLTVTMSGDGDEVIISRSGSSFIVAAAGIADPTCGGATTDNVATVNVTGDTLAQTLTIDLSGGQFEPGGKVEPTGLSEVEWVVDLGRGADTLRIQGGSGSDTLRWGAPGVNLNDDDDVDVTVLQGVTPILAGGDGDDHLFGSGEFASTGTPLAGPIIILGEGGNDELAGGNGDDAVNGGTGDDFLATRSTGDDGADSHRGGPGSDTMSYIPRLIGVVVTVDGVANDGQDSNGDGLAEEGDLVAVETLMGSEMGDTLVGNRRANTLNGGEGDDTLLGMGGTDILFGHLGDDVVDGGRGDGDLVLSYESDGADAISGGLGVADTAQFSSRTDDMVVTIDGLANDGEDADGDLVAEEGDNVGADLENVSLGSGDDLLTGNDDANVLDGGGGNDVVNGAGGNDQVGGGLGDDVVNGGGGDDVFGSGNLVNGADELNGGPGFDVVSYVIRSTDVVASIDGIANDGEDANGNGVAEEGDDIGTDIERIDGGGGNDSLTGSAAGDELVGHGGNDTLSGLGSNDTLGGGVGDDVIHGGAGDDYIRGWYGDDALFGNADNDTIYGDADTDTINGGTGTDVCYSGEFVVSCEA